MIGKESITAGAAGCLHGGAAHTAGTEMGMSGRVSTTAGTAGCSHSEAVHAAGTVGRIASVLRQSELLVLRLLKKYR